jgi:uncharacterized protein YcbX
VRTKKLLTPCNQCIIVTPDATNTNQTGGQTMNKPRLSKASQKIVDTAMAAIRNGHIKYGIATLASLHRCGNSKERAIIEEYRENNTIFYNGTDIINDCIVPN